MRKLTLSEFHSNHQSSQPLLLCIFVCSLDAEYAVEKPDMGIPLDPTLTVSSEISYRDILPHFDEIPPSEIVTIRQYTGEADSIFLEHNKPKFIIMYDPDPAFVRRVEVSIFY
jgi:hypothetical protein